MTILRTTIFRIVPLVCLFTLDVLPAGRTADAAEPVRSSLKQPNIVLIVADDLGYRELGCFGQEKIRTPHLDRLAARGMKLTQHYAGNAVCAPSRCVLMTGQHPGTAWIRNNSEAQPEGQKPIPASEYTMAEMLAKRGYVTGAFGKWGLGGPGTEGDPIHQGFNRFFGYNCQRHAHSFYPSYLWSDLERVPLQNDPPVPGHAKLRADADPADPASYLEFQGQDYAPDHIRREALTFLDENKENPFFLFFPSTLPHVALHVPQQELEPYLKLGWEETPFTAARGGYTPHFTPKAAYAAMISRLDADVGALLEKLDQLGLTEKTLIVFSSDNGTTHLDREVDAEFFASVGELRGLKGSLYEGGVRVPTIVSMPGLVPAGTESGYISGFEDWMPTFADLTGGWDETAEPVDGISLMPTLRGESQQEREYLYREFPGYGGQVSLREGDWKLVRQKLGKGGKAVELYNIAEDPSESQDVAKDNPERVAAMVKRITEIRRPSDLFPLQQFDR